MTSINKNVPQHLKCVGRRVVKNHAGILKRKCLQYSFYECPSCDNPLCKKCAIVASRHRKDCYGGAAL